MEKTGLHETDKKSSITQALSHLRTTFWLLSVCPVIVVIGFVVTTRMHNIIPLFVLTLIALGALILGAEDAKRGIQLSRLARGKEPIGGLGCLTYIITPIGLIVWSISEYRMLRGFSGETQGSKSDSDRRQQPPAN